MLLYIYVNVLAFLIVLWLPTFIAFVANWRMDRSIYDHDRRQISKSANYVRIALVYLLPAVLLWPVSIILAIGWVLRKGYFLMSGRWHRLNWLSEWKADYKGESL